MFSQSFDLPDGTTIWHDSAPVLNGGSFGDGQFVDDHTYQTVRRRLDGKLEVTEVSYAAIGRDADGYPTDDPDEVVEFVATNRAESWETSDYPPMYRGDPVETTYNEESFYGRSDRDIKREEGESFDDWLERQREVIEEAASIGLSEAVRVAKFTYR